MTAPRKRYALVGTGGRGRMFVDAICGRYRDNAELVALCDLSQTRMDFYNQQIQEQHGLPPVPTFHADDFDRMVAETRPEVVIVTTMDATHHIYIIRAMELGCDAITEKPMTVDAEKARAIFDAIERTGRQLRVTFNYRYAPIATKARELIMQGVVGKPLHVNFQWVLDTFHGADYFRRWHREKDKSGGLLVHKATHHFDLINWWIQSYPQEVFAMGDLLFYGRKNAEARGERYEYDRYTGNEAARHDPFALRLDQHEVLRHLYLEAEKDTGYIRDRNVFGDNITVEDTMSVTARYRNGAILTYSLIAYSPWEGYRIAITGDRGRLEVELVESVGKQFIAGEEETIRRDEESEQRFGGKHIRVFPMFGRPYEVEIPEGVGGHGGGDRVMLEQIFSPNPPADPFNRAASHIDGAASILLGIAANESIATGRPVRVDDLLPLPV
ncbi:Gfo/Idh/MocA family oxidoreductase [Litorilinea aerophila]|uniref:Gfo/Idh/MocA family oxidoreductase n=1 Tax=Litorilinea aerophila TaxID=1204385 RepID=A0A540VGG0_9CHLR|nr:Gfo/Idh/MocA family oxidoreductase [Litorilinea aerophila]MCC9076546.1 Gfo/Idh/MocA family oxidoreductase [Litorilinea aerophila]GIV79545.1 MAG: dehydrogenase [Litorilinea sp.]